MDLIKDSNGLRFSFINLHEEILQIDNGKLTKIITVEEVLNQMPEALLLTGKKGTIEEILKRQGDFLWKLSS